ncbi:inositol monophosphatase [Salinisphaera sp. Q1T1-3]|uniref:inositol monophosphatase family protein n=1 Tax=Salinisphaera sp. Q1T1-3 TaxID=2321229 RepID=UPI000E76695D|nr:inositol monophosphatase [Salinisphaera sp. Q1T1-3]RJS91609.1 inositol monophosphatase [Salinisphaera sp. Q1T1-3]
MTATPTFDSIARHRLIDIVRDAARAEILPRFRRLSDNEIRAKSAPDDLVTDADQAAEARMTQAIAAAWPDAVIIGEEAVAAGHSDVADIATAETAIIIDPIDGTWNYARGLNQFGVIIAVTCFGETVFGLLYDPLADDWITATRGEGAWFGAPDGTEKRLDVATRSAPAQMIGSTSLHLFAEAEQRRLAALYPDFARVMSFHCACHEYRTMAFGHVDFMLTSKLMPWDHAAGVLVIEEAGGHAATLDGQRYAPTRHQGRMLVATSRENWTLLQDRLSFLA